MLKLQWIQIFLRLIPEMLLILWGIHVIAGKRINVKVYIFLSIIMGLVVFFVRMLPIYYGVHTFIIAILTICAMAIIDIPIIKAIYGTILMTLILFLSESINFEILNVLNINIKLITNPIRKSVLTCPSLIIMLLSIMAIRYFLIKKKGFKSCAK